MHPCPHLPVGGTEDHWLRTHYRHIMAQGAVSIYSQPALFHALRLGLTDSHSDAVGGPLLSWQGGRPPAGGLLGTTGRVGEGACTDTGWWLEYHPLSVMRSTLAALQALRVCML